MERIAEIKTGMQHIMCCYVACGHAKDISDHSDQITNRFIMFFDLPNIGLETCYVQLSIILAELSWKIDFSLMVALFFTLSCVSHINNSFIMRLDPQNMGLDTSSVEISALWAEIWRNIHFPVMAALICIKMVCGTFWQLFNIANRFLWYFSNLETSIRNWFPGGCTIPPSSCPTS